MPQISNPKTMKKIVFLGSKKIGYDCLTILNKYSKELNYEIVGVLTNSRGDLIKEYCLQNKLPLLKSLDEYLLLEHIDIAISVQYHKLLNNRHISKAKQIIVNLHMAALPEYRGCNQFSFAIIDGAKEFGTTIHRLEEGIDDGAIISERRFKIPKNCWVEELYNITFSESVLLFKETLPSLVNNTYSLTAQEIFFESRASSLHYRDEINHVKEIDLSWTKEKIEKYIRATYMPGFPPPFIVLNNHKLKLIIDN
jgi:methionyl-tRNA formyltransferase